MILGWAPFFEIFDQKIITPAECDENAVASSLCAECNGTGVEQKPWMNGECCLMCTGTGLPVDEPLRIVEKVMNNGQQQMTLLHKEFTNGK